MIARRPTLGETVDRETVVGTHEIERAVSIPGGPHLVTQETVEEVSLPPGFAYGEPTSGSWSRLADDEEVKVGDIVRTTYRMGVPFFQGWQRDFIVWRLNQDPRFRLRAVALNEEERKLVIETEIVQPFSPAFLVPIVIVGVLAGALIFLTTVSIERLSKVKPGTLLSGIGILMFAGLAVAALALIRPKLAA